MVTNKNIYKNPEKMKRKFQNISFLQVLSFLLLVLAMVSGGGAMAVGTVVNDAPIGDEGAQPATASEAAANEPANPSNNDLHTPGDGVSGETLNGTQLSSSQQRKENNIDDEWDRGITQFQPWRTPLLSIARRVSRKVNIQNWTIKHARIGGDTLDGRVTTAITQETDGSLKLTSSNFTGSLKAFYRGTTVFCPFIDGYAEDGTTVEGCLELFMVDVTTSYVLVVPINGPLKTGQTAGDTYEVREFGPNGVSSNKGLPANAYLCAGASIAGESQLLITPENNQPRYEEFSVQKKLLNIVWTNDFEKVKKKMPWHVADVKANAIRNYNLRAERTYWMGAKTAFRLSTATSLLRTHTARRAFCGRSPTRSPLSAAGLPSATLSPSPSCSIPRSLRTRTAMPSVARRSCSGFSTSTWATTSASSRWKMSRSSTSTSSA